MNQSSSRSHVSSNFPLVTGLQCSYIHIHHMLLQAIFTISMELLEYKVTIHTYIHTCSPVVSKTILCCFHTSIHCSQDSLNPAPHSESKNHNGSYIQAKLHLVDLAGSERAKKTGAVGARFKESVGINQVAMRPTSLADADADDDPMLLC